MSSFEFQCSSQRDKSYWISTYGSFGSSFLLISFLLTFIYFSLWRKTKSNSTSNPFIGNASHILFIGSLALKAVSFIISGILLRFDNIKWHIIQPILGTIPQASVILSYSLVFLTWSLLNIALIPQQKQNQFSRIAYGIAGFAGVVLVINAALNVMFYVSESETVNNINIWLSFLRDQFVAIAFIIYLSALRKHRNVTMSGKSSTEKAINISAIIVLTCMVIRGITIPLESFLFSPVHVADKTAQCGTASLLFFIFQQLICEVLPAFATTVIQGMLEKVISYEALE